MKINHGSSAALGTWCLGHCFSLAGDDLRNFSSVVDKSVKLIISTRTFLSASNTRVSKLKIICNRIGIKYISIPDAFEDRWQSWMGLALEAFIKLLPALYILFSELDRLDSNRRSPIGYELTNNFVLVAFMLRWSTIMKKEKILDKELQE